MADLANAMSDLDYAYSVLDIKPGASLREVNEAYEDMRDLWRPERLTENPRLRARAAAKNREITAAYELLFNELSRTRKPASAEIVSSRPAAQIAKHSSSLYEDALAGRGRRKTGGLPIWLILVFVVIAIGVTVFFLTSGGTGEENTSDVLATSTAPESGPGLTEVPSETEIQNPGRSSGERLREEPLVSDNAALAGPEAAQPTVRPPELTPPSQPSPSSQNSQAEPRREGGPLLIRDELFETENAQAIKQQEQTSFERLRSESAAVRELMSGVAGYDFVDWTVVKQDDQEVWIDVIAKQIGTQDETHFVWAVHRSTGQVKALNEAAREFNTGRM